MRTIVHVTHEAVQKVGGIGAVLQGLLTSKPYRTSDQRTILLGPMSAEQVGDGQFSIPVETLYSSISGVSRHPAGAALERLCHDFRVHIFYGRREFCDPYTQVSVWPEVVLIDVSRINVEKVNVFKGKLWREYHIDSSRYENIWDYELYVRLAEPARAVLSALGAADFGDECVVLAHEYMGLPTALCTRLDSKGVFRSIFYAHEVATVRRLVEDHAGHDVSFYNLLPLALQKKHYVEDIFGSQDGYYRHALVKASCYCDKIFAVGDYVLNELRFLGPQFATAKIDVTYNGIPAEQISYEQKLASKERLRDYAEALLGLRPDYVFTRVTRMAVSKGLWRDLRVLEHLEREFRKTGRTGVLFVLSTEIGPRRPEDIREMERWWKWPVAHREVPPDMSGGEALFYQGVQEFNARARQIKIIFVNQFGWAQALCGQRMPAKMEFMDIRRGSDVEFGQSVYEPFGIAQLEPLTFGGICVISQVCGCVGFVQRVTGGRETPNLLVADYGRLDKGPWNERKLLDLDRDCRDQYERQAAGQVARRLMELLPADAAAEQALLAGGYELARQMSWDVVADEMVLPGIESICRKPCQAEVLSPE